MVNQVFHKVCASSESDEDTESETELKDASPEISRTCFPHLLSNNQTDKKGMLVSRIFFTSFKAMTRRTKQKNFKPMEQFLREMARERPPRFSLKQIQNFTWNFSSKIGEGGFGTIYKGLMPNGAYVAVKLMSGNSHRVNEELIDEVSILSKTYHRNIVKLLGYCVEGDAKAIVYEYMPNGSLDHFLYNNRNDVNLEMLYNIAIEIAKVITYLHEECPEVIIHRDLKPSNILLGPNFSPKLADFGLAVQYDRDESDGRIEVSVAGTIGYIDPSYALDGFVTRASDVYGFGMVLLDILGRPKAYGVGFEDHISFPQKVWDKFKLGNLVYFKEQERRMSMAALWCIQINPKDRPSMSTVVNILKGDTEVILPPRPSLQVFPYADSESARSTTSVHSALDYGSDNVFEEHR